MYSNRLTDKGVTMTIVNQGVAEAAEARLAVAVAHDRSTAWSPAWVADRLVATSDYRRVKNEDNCCNGLQCYHYTASVTKKVRGKGAAKPTGLAVSLQDALLRRGVGGV